MSVLTEGAVAALRSLAADLLASDANTDREIELLSREADTRSATGGRIAGDYETAATVSGLVETDYTSSPRRAGRTLAEGEISVTLPYDTDLDGVVALRLASGDTYEILPGQNNLDDSYRATIVIRAKRTSL